MITKLFRFSLLAALLFCSSTISAITLQDAVLSGSRPSSLPEMVNSIDGENYYCVDGNSKINLVSYRTGEVVKTVFDAATSRNCPFKTFEGFYISPDETKILLYVNSTPVYRHSFKAKFYVYEIKRNNMKPLSTTDFQEIPTFSPDGRMVAFVVDNNVWIKKLDFDIEVQVTTDGKKNEIINAVPDWVYQEEFGMLNSFAFNNESTVLCFIKWDESKVPLFKFPLYEGFCNRKSEYRYYPGEFEYKYPVAGETNSTVQVLSYDIDNRKTKVLDIPMDADGYIPAIRFAGATDKLMVTTLNRNQNFLTIHAANPMSTVSKVVYKEQSKSWISIDKFLDNLNCADESFVVWSDRSGFGHIYKYSISGNLLSQITKGDWMVTKYYGYDTATASHYFQCTKDDVTGRSVYRLNAKGVLTKVAAQPGTNSATFSGNMNYFILCHSDYTTPPVYTMWNARTSKKLRTLESNKEYASKYCAPGIPVKEPITIQASGYSLNGYVIKPAGFDPSCRYPVILSQYSGPASQMVLNRWSFDWEQYAALQGYVVVRVDGRGTGGRGKEWESLVYMKLGQLEAADQVLVADYMAKQSYVDSSRIGIWGWSYGGYSVLMAMSRADSKFAAGVSIAPVTDWRFYDTIYTERYMRTPQQNYTGYDAASAINAIPNLKGRLLIMAGTADDNVHLTNTINYVSELLSQNKFCDMLLYPNMDHSIKTCDARFVLYSKVFDFFDNNLKK